MHGDALATSLEPQTFRRGCLDIYQTDVDLQYVGEPASHCTYMRRHLRLLCDDSYIDVTDTGVALRQHVIHFFQ